MTRIEIIVFAAIFGAIIGGLQYYIKKHIQRKNDHTHDNTDIVFDSDYMEAILKCNTCNSERVLKFKDIRTGELTEVANIRYDSELEEYKEKYGIDEVKVQY